MYTTFVIRPGTPGDFPIIIGLITEAANWLRTKGTDQWARPWPDRKSRDCRVWDGLLDGKTWIVWDGDIPAATITIDQEADPKLWSELAQSEPAVYVHRLVVSRAYAGLRLGAHLLAWAGERAGDAYEARWIRVDVWTTNHDLHAYYIRQGFAFFGQHSGDDYPSGALFQKAIERPARTFSSLAEAAASTVCS